MKVALVDVDGHNFPNLALMKLSAWHKAQGDFVEWYMPLFSRPERIYASKVFTFTPDYIDYAYGDPEPIKGGTGYDMQVKLPDEVEQMTPDYDLYPQYDFACGFLTRGCIRKCPWCVVPRKEGHIQIVSDIEKLAVRKDVVLMDNNFLAAPEDFVHEQLEKARRLKVRIDFNQALDARLVTPKNAQWLASARWIRYIRFSCDTMSVIEPVLRAIALLREAGFTREIFIYILAQEVESALKRIDILTKADAKVIPFVMPYRDLDNGGDIASEELKHLARWCNRGQSRAACSFEEYDPFRKKEKKHK